MTNEHMNLRDRFAMQALAGILANGSPILGADGHVVERKPTLVAELAYQVADAMLKARSDG